MNDRAMEMKHGKVRGEWAEMRFMACAAEYGLCVSKPWGETTHYDFAVEYAGQFLRVQVKSTGYKEPGGRGYYRCTVRGSAGAYQGHPFDFLAAFVIPEDLWFIIPAELVIGKQDVILNPRSERSKFQPYREATRQSALGGNNTRVQALFFGREENSMICPRLEGATHFAVGRKSFGM
jgi:PD-(D/E)XK endonuclease